MKYFKKSGFKTIGCEPAKNLTKELKKNCHYVMDDFWSFEKLDYILNKHNLKKPKLITAIGMFYDLDDPSKFIGDISKALDDNGIFIAQLMCLKSMLQKNDLGNICHEHLEFYSYKSLIYLFETNGFEIFKVEENDVNAGSYRIYAKKFKKKSIKVRENTSLKDVRKFIDRVKLSRIKTVNFIKKGKKKKKEIFVYASTKGNTILQYFNLDNKLIKYAADRSPEKWGKYTVGTGIKIISEKKARQLNPDYFLVMPWGFLKEFVKEKING